MTAHWRAPNERRNMKSSKGISASTMATGNAHAPAVTGGDQGRGGWRSSPRLAAIGAAGGVATVLLLLLVFTLTLDGLSLALVGLVGAVIGSSLLALAWWYSGPQAEMAMLSQLVRQSPDGRLITDHSGRILYANDACLELFSLSDGMRVMPVSYTHLTLPTKRIV